MEIYTKDSFRMTKLMGMVNYGAKATIMKANSKMISLMGWV